MSRAAYEQLADNLEGQQKALLAAEARPTLTRVLSPVGAYTMGVIPLVRDDDGIVFASFPGACPDLAGVLRSHVGSPVTLVEFDENVMGFFVDKIYLKGRSANIHTFGSPDFLRDPGQHAKLFEAKVEQPEPTGCDLAPEWLALCDLHLASDLRNLDRPQPARLENYRLGEFCPAFRRSGGGWTVWAEQALKEDVPLLLQFSEDYSGEEFYRDLSAVVVQEWPHILFPSEIQLLGLGADASLHVYVDGAVETVSPGAGRRLGAEYWLLRHGWRFHRRLTLEVRRLEAVKRDAVAYAPPFRGAGAEELARWLGAR